MWRNILILVFGIASLFFLATLGEGDGKRGAKESPKVEQADEVVIPSSLPPLVEGEPSSISTSALLLPDAAVPEPPQCLDSNPELCWVTCVDGLDPCPDTQLCHTFDGRTPSVSYCVPRDQSQDTARDYKEGFDPSHLGAYVPRSGGEVPLRDGGSQRSGSRAVPARVHHRSSGPGGGGGDGASRWCNLLLPDAGCGEEKHRNLHLPGLQLTTHNTGPVF